MTNVDVQDSDNYQELGDPLVTDIFEPGPRVPRADGIDYLRDVNAVVQDIINLFRATLEAVERSLSRDLDSAASSPRGNFDSAFPHEETGDLLPAESENDDEGVPKEASEAARAFLTRLRFLVDYTETRINVTPAQRQEQNRKIRHAVRSGRKTEMDIKSLNDALASQRTEHKKSIAKLNEELNDCINASDRRSEEIRNEIERTVNESETEMIKYYKNFAAKEELLRSKIEILETRFNDSRRRNILVENVLRDKRREVEDELLDRLAKYDEEIGGRHREMENSAREFELLNLQGKMLEDNVMIDLRKLHDDLQQEKAEALLRILNEKVEKFVRNRAARVIQKAWRAYWERHCAKKKKKSRKK